MAARTVLLVIPANNSTLAGEMVSLLPDHPRQLLARVPRPARTLVAEDIPAYAAATLAAAEPFVVEYPDLVVYGCTAAGFLAGPDGNRAISDRLAQRFGVPVVNTADAMLEVLQRDQAGRIAVVTPYLPAVNDGLRRYLTTADIVVSALSSFECATTDALGQITEDEVEALALATVGPQDQALFIACSQLPTANILPRLRQRLGIPVWSSIAATAAIATSQNPVREAA